jgi:hypothetical protein
MRKTKKSTSIYVVDNRIHGYQPLIEDWKSANRMTISAIKGAPAIFGSSIAKYTKQLYLNI